jgi:hypothetical protein
MVVLPARNAGTSASCSAREETFDEGSRTVTVTV